MNKNMICAIVIASILVTCRASLAQVPTEVVLPFSRGTGNSQAGLVGDAAGNFYGTTYGDPAIVSHYGTVFEVPANQNTIRILASFSGVDGSAPFSGVNLDSRGDLFGTTSLGGYYNTGTLYEVVAGSNAITKLADLNVGTFYPASTSGVVLDSAGNIYGTLARDPGVDSGSIFELNAQTHNLTKIALFNASTGQGGDLTIDGSGNLYGSTGTGGANGDGIVFELPAHGHTILTLASFDGATTPSARGGVVLDASGNIFGTTYAGGDAGFGSLYKVAANSGVVTTLASFSGGDGSHPMAHPTIGPGGILYGTTIFGGGSGGGTIYQFDPSTGVLTSLISFDGTPGVNPLGTVIRDDSGYFYTTTSGSGPGGGGAVIVPEPSSFALVSVGALALLGYARRGRGRA